MVIVDTGSTDSTVSLVKDYAAQHQFQGLKVFEAGNRFDQFLTKQQARKINKAFIVPGENPIATPQQRVFHFANARNFALTLCTNDLILELDASDVLENADWKAFQNLLSPLLLPQEKQKEKEKETASSSPPAYVALEYLWKFAGRACFVTRFYNRQFCTWFGCIHEQIVAKDGSILTSKTIRCDPSIFSVRHDRTVDKPRTYEPGLAMDLLKYPERSQTAFQLASLLVDKKQLQSAAAILEQRCLQSATILPPLRSEAASVLGRCKELQGQTAAAVQAYWEAFQADDTRREPLLNLATLQLKEKKYQQVVCLAQAALTIPHTIAWMDEEQTNYTWRPHSLLYRALLALERKEQAQQHYEMLTSILQNKGKEGPVQVVVPTKSTEQFEEEEEEEDASSECGCEECRKEAESKRQTKDTTGSSLAEDDTTKNRNSTAATEENSGTSDVIWLRPSMGSDSQMQAGMSC